MQDKVVLGHMIKLPVVDLTDQGAFVALHGRNVAVLL